MKRRYLALCMQQPIDWLRACADSPTPGMRPVHIALIRIAIRKKEGTA